MMDRRQLAQWLGELGSEGVALTEIAELLHFVLDASRQSIALASPDELGELRFALAVLRDVFPRDDDVRAWLVLQSPELNGAMPADLLSAGRIREFVDLAVAEWNKPRTFRLGPSGAMFVTT